MPVAQPLHTSKSVPGCSLSIPALYLAYTMSVEGRDAPPTSHQLATAAVLPAKCLQLTSDSW